jgi:uncharacterized membrane protein
MLKIAVCGNMLTTASVASVGFSILYNFFPLVSVIFAGAILESIMMMRGRREIFEAKEAYLVRLWYVVSSGVSKISELAHSPLNGSNTTKISVLSTRAGCKKFSFLCKYFQLSCFV